MIDDGTGLRERLLDLADRIGQAGINGFGNELRDIALSAVAPPPVLEGTPALSPDSDVWTSLDIILASAQTIKADKPLVAADIIGHIQQIVATLEPLTAASPAAPAQPEGGEAVAWATHHEPPMLFPTRAEAAAYCCDDEQPIGLYARPAPAQPEGGEAVENMPAGWLAAVESLVSACEREFTSPDTDMLEDADDAVALPDSEITFGDIWRARDAIDNLRNITRPAPAQQAVTDGDAVFAPHWPEGLKPDDVYEVRCDDKGRNGGSWLRLVIANDCDVHLMMQDWEEVPNGEPNPLPTLRCRTGMGGGRNGRTYQALLWLAQAMRLDAADRSPALTSTAAKAAEGAK